MKQLPPFPTFPACGEGRERAVAQSGPAFPNTASLHGWVGPGLRVARGGPPSGLQPRQKPAEEYAMAQIKWALSGLVIIALWLAAGASAVQGQTPGTVTVFEGALVITGDGSPPIENAAIVVTGNRITAVWRPRLGAAPAGAGGGGRSRHNRDAGAGR